MERIPDEGREELGRARRRIEALRLLLQASEYEAVARHRHATALQASSSWRLTAGWRKVEAILPRWRSGREAEERAGAAAMLPGLQALQRVALMERSLPARAMLAVMATGDGDVEAWMGEAGAGSAAAALVQRCRQADATLALARTLAGQCLFDGDPALAAALYRWHVDAFGGPGWDAVDHIQFIDLLDGLGRKRQAEEWLARSGLRERAPWDHACLAGNLAQAGADAASLAPMNRLLAAQGLEPLALRDAHAAAIDRLHCVAPVSRRSGLPLVSIVMPVYRAGSAADTAIASVLAQTWPELELIVVDDGSPEAEFARLEDWPAKDPRVRLLRAERNGGTYRARNLGLAEARGEFVTCHDADDWSHPRKIELQVEQLRRHPGRIGNLSRWARVLPDLRVQRFSMRGHLVYPNLSSLMFRRAPVMAALGQWDEVRYGADNEFYKRLELVFGRELDVVGAMPLSFGRVHRSSLTSGTLGRGYVSFERRCYESAWRHWHRGLVQAPGGARLTGAGERRFTVPASMLPDRKAEPDPRSYRLVVVADYCLEGAVAEYFASRIRDMLEGEGRIALCQMRSFDVASLSHWQIDWRIQDLLETSGIDLLHAQDRAECEHIHLLYPRVLEFATHLRATGIRAGKVTFEPPDTLSGEGHVIPEWDRGGCMREAARLFGSVPSGGP
ncbi:glycosyltransferase family 2 protein [Stenotrophomonas mori]|uniref:Glycosyltransferase family 2 protein n=1 Tax=Stenotrophomonas mori TaxID=2871096 RepID=A0ABT0SIX6_9GAMM|nr:glycosyltransferase family A protein [Stenotrophomonas mori]MCL7714935.1 glycosyltransferase family 2 protein [Stenotrophomonas mori]